MIFNTNDTPMYLLTAKNKKVRLGDCPVGLFFYKKQLYVKTMHSAGGLPNCYSVSTGDYITNLGSTLEECLNIKVKPVKLMDLLKPKTKE